MGEHTWGTEVAVGLGVEIDEPILTTSDMNPTDSCATSSAIFNRWHVQTQRDELAELQKVWQHQEELTNEARCQSRGGTRQGGSLSSCGAMRLLRSKGWPGDDCRHLRRVVGHREHGRPFPLPLPEVHANPFKLCYVRVPSAKTGSHASATPFSRDCDRFELTHSHTLLVGSFARPTSRSSASPFSPTGSQSSVFRRVRAKVIGAGPPPVGLL